MDNRKDAGILNRKKITIHSFRRYAKTVISNQAGQDYSEWFLGHAKNPYWTMKENARREIYQIKIMKYLTFLDYQTLEATGKNIEKKLVEKEIGIESLKDIDSMKTDEITGLTERIQKMESDNEMASKKWKEIESLVDGLQIKFTLLMSLFLCLTLSLAATPAFTQNIMMILKG